MKSVLTLETNPARSSIEVDGTPYDLLGILELSIVDASRVLKMGSRIGTLYAELDTRTSEELDEVSRLLDELCRIVWLAPAEIQDRLRDQQRLSVAMTFIQINSGSNV